MLVRRRAFKQCNQALALGLGQAWVKHQLALRALVIADQCPGVKAKVCVFQAQVVDGNLGQLLKPTAEVVAQIADQAAGKG
ncbi:hypothetical protein D3C80_1982000 [compost metagenome]